MQLILAKPCKHFTTKLRTLNDRGGESEVIGKLLLKQTALMFSHWQRVRDGSLNHTDFSILVQPIRTEVKTMLEIGGLIDPPTTRKTCANILKLVPAL